MRIAGITTSSIVDGPGLRITVFCQGCELRCVGCHNPGTQPLDGGREIDVAEVVELINNERLATGLTLSGGEPTLQAAACAKLAQAAKARGWDVWCYSGYTWPVLERRATREPDLARLLELVDTVVAGPYVAAQRTLSLPWRGSSNQVLVQLGKSRQELSKSSS
ncbi:MAG: 4Fe-4S cluster-binding domain-containing protein [Propionibacteriaceae bacterium]